MFIEPRFSDILENIRLLSTMNNWDGLDEFIRENPWESKSEMSAVLRTTYLIKDRLPSWNGLYDKFMDKYPTAHRPEDFVQAMHDEDLGVTGYMCLTDFECELGGASGGNRVYPSIENLKEYKPCAMECGIVEVRVYGVRIASPTKYMSDD